MEQVNDDHEDGGSHGDDQVLKAWKRRKRKTKRLMTMVYLIGAFFWHSKHQVGVSAFRIDSRTIKRGETHREMRLSKCH